MLLPRVLTAAVGIPLLLWLIHLGSLPYLGLVVAVTVLSLYEYGLILWIGERPVQRVITVLGGGLMALCVAAGPAGGGVLGANAAGMAVTFLLLAVVLRELFRRDHSLERAALSLFGAFFIGWTLPHLALLRDLRPHGEEYTLLLFLTVWVADCAAYFAGHAVGSHRLAPVLSPRKTWEGAAAGFLAAVAFAVLARSWFLREALTVPGAAAFGLLIGVGGQVSDLAESFVKRAVRAKDSSALLPGHGGVLDRFDSFLLTAPTVYYVLALK